MERLIATPVQFEKVARFHEEQAARKAAKRREVSRKAAEYEALGIEKSIARDMARFGL